MKKYIISILTISIAFLGCSTDLDINKDPDALDPTKASLSAQLPAAIAGLAGSEGGSAAIIGGMWSQFWTQSNSASQYNDIDSYSIGTKDYNWIWDEVFDALGDVRNIKRKAEETENWNYYLIATTLEVQASQFLTDYYGSIPYKEANDANNLQPKFNTGEEVYGFMIEDLDKALSKNLSQSKGEIPSKDDFIFNGEMDKWKKFANTLKLKIFMRQTNSSRSSIANTGITQLLNSGVTFLNEDASMTQFVDEANQSNPLFESNNRQLNVATNLRMSKTLSSYLDINGDTRRNRYYTAGNPLNQGDNNNPNSSATFAVVNNLATDPVIFLSKEESLLLQAEALERYKSGVGAKELYEQAIIHNFSRYSMDGSTYASTSYKYPTGTFEEKLEAIITQKWISCFPGNGAEAFFEKNRTDYPKTSTVSQTDNNYIAGQMVYSLSGSTGGKFPKRLAYPLTERNGNTNAPDLESITKPIWWAKN